MSGLARPVAIAGVGYSELSRKGEPHPDALALTAARAALADAGVRTSDIDGIFEYKFGPESPGAQDMARLLGVPDLAAFADIMASNPSGLGGVLAGVMAVASGACETVLVFRCLTRSAGHQGGVASGPETVSGRDQFLTPMDISAEFWSTWRSRSNAGWPSTAAARRTSAASPSTRDGGPR